MSLIKKINDPNGKKYDDFSIGSLVLDTEPIPGSFNTITSDAVVKAIDKAKDDMQEKIDEVTLDPSAVALGNVHLLDEVTEFHADGCILVDSETNGPGEMSKDTLLQLTSQNALAGNIATEFVPNVTEAKKGRPYIYGGNVVVAKEEYKGLWNASKFDVVDFAALTQYFHTIFFKDLSNSFLVNLSIITNVGVGNVVDLTPSFVGSNYCLVEDCEAGDEFIIRGVGLSGPLLWCFVDSENKVVSVSGDSVSTGANGLVLYAPVSGKLIFNSTISTNIGAPYLKRIGSSQKLHDDFYAECYVFEKKDVSTGYINTSVGVGNVVTLTPVADGTYRHSIIDCKKGDVFYIRGVGANLPRLWCFVDSENKVVNVSGASVSSGADGKYLMASCDGKFIFNTNNTTPYEDGFSVEKKTSLKDSMYDVVQFLKEETPVKKDVIKRELLERGRIATNVGVGNVVNYSVTYDSTYYYVVLACKKGDRFVIKGKGGSAPRLWCFVDDEDKVISVSGDSVSADGLTIIAPANGKVIYNSEINPPVGTPYFKVDYRTQEYVDEKFESVSKAISNIKGQVIEFDDQPYEEVTDYSSDIVRLALPTMMDLVTPKFDALVSEFPSLITKYDAAELVDMEYPRYANGISSGDPDYLETPAYKLYIYKISDINTYVGNNSSWPKKKLFIVGAVHGSEELTGFNLFALASHILRKPSKDLYEMLSKFDIWLMPFVNGYGIIHQTRPNANGVDISRNFGTEYWTVSGLPGQETYSGASADSEFEVQLIEALKTYISPDFYVDHHCTPIHASSQFYSISQSEDVRLKSYNALVQLSRSLSKALPDYFGTKYHLFCDNEVTGTLPKSITPFQGSSGQWFFERGVQSSTIEIYGYINYLDGEVANVDYGPNVHIVNELSLRCQLAHYLNIVL